MVLGVCRQFLRDPNDVDDAFQATFLVLVRKAGSLRQKELLGNWLYGVACRVAMRARSLSAPEAGRSLRRGEVEPLASRSGRGRHQPPRTRPRPGREERPLLHEEVSRLPQKYRTPIVLCYFEGLTHDEAAARLGWPIGTVKGRLSRARDLLRRDWLAAASRFPRRPSRSSSRRLRAEGVRSRVADTLDTQCRPGGCQGSGAALAAPSAVSLSVASLTEGVMNAMVFSQMTLVSSAPRRRRDPDDKCLLIAFQPRAGAKPGAGSSGTSTSPAKAARARQTHGVAGGRDRLADHQRPGKAPTDVHRRRSSAVLDPSQYYNWSLRLLEAERNAPAMIKGPTRPSKPIAQRLKRS